MRCIENLGLLQLLLAHSGDYHPISGLECCFAQISLASCREDSLADSLYNSYWHDGDSSSLTNEKDHHYFLNSADVCW